MKINYKFHIKMSETESIVQHTGKYGWIYPDSNHFNDKEALGGNFLHYKVIKVKVWTGVKENKTIINGIQFFYRNLMDGKEFTPGPHKGEIGLNGQEEIVLKSNEYFVDFHIRIDQEVTQIGFTTNKGEKFLFGGETGEDKITELKGKNVIVFAPFGCFKNELQSCGVFYLDKKEFLKVSFSGYFELRFLLKNKPDFKKKCEEKKFSVEDSVLLRACTLPDTAFNSIIRFCLY